MLHFIKKIFRPHRITKTKKEKPMNANFTDKERNLLLETVLQKELGVVLAADVKDLRSKTDVFANSNEISIEKVSNKQGTTKVSVFVASYEDQDGDTLRAYMPTI